MALRLTLAFFLSLLLHCLPFVSWFKTKKPEIKISSGETYMVEILPGGQTTMVTSSASSLKKPTESGMAKVSSLNSVQASASGGGSGSGSGIGAGVGEGIQTDWMIDKPVYSDESRKNEEEGKVEVIVACKKDGGCNGSIKKSSGFWRLDQSVLRSVQKIKVSKDEIRELSFVFRLDDH